jgi:hypothetical protein
MYNFLMLIKEKMLAEIVHHYNQLESVDHHRQYATSFVH